MYVYFSLRKGVRYQTVSMLNTHFNTRQIDE